MVPTIPWNGFWKSSAPAPVAAVGIYFSGCHLHRDCICDLCDLGDSGTGCRLFGLAWKFYINITPWHGQTTTPEKRWPKKVKKGKIPKSKNIKNKSNIKIVKSSEGLKKRASKKYFWWSLRILKNMWFLYSKKSKYMLTFFVIFTFWRKMFDVNRVFEKGLEHLSSIC